MIVIIDAIPVQQVGHRPHRDRCYYTVSGYPNLLLVSQGGSLEKFQGKKAALLWNYEGIDSTIVCDSFPEAPRRWRNEQIVQASISVKERMRGKAIPLSDALRKGMKKYGK